MYPEFKSLPLSDLEHEGISAGPRLTKSKLAIEMRLNITDVDYDGAIPHDWLENFLSFCQSQEKHHTINHLLVTSTTFWVYYKEDFIGRPYSGCTEVQDAINSIQKAVK